ncbi:MAG: dihydrodipicolinate synthase family protein [Planctomycetes bacterium]|nr:dihydrodipicolinate synthase family protein [Planctomycetota bacterium]
MTIADHHPSESVRFQGIVPPLVTPLLGRDTLDVDGARRLLDHVIAGGVHAVFILGTTGEAPSLSYRLRRETIRLVCRHADGRVPVLVGITDTAFVESVELARVAREAGAAAVVLSTPYYFPAGQTELIQYVERIAAELPLPIMLYNMPSLTKVWFETETLRTLAGIRRIVGVKDSGGDLAYFERLANVRREVRPDWSILMGPEDLLTDAMRLGADGGVHGGANVYPRLFVNLYQALRDGDDDESARLAEIVARFQAVYQVGKYASRFIKATKCALSLEGICGDRMAEPFNHFLAPERGRVRSILDSLRPPT